MKKLLFIVVLNTFLGYSQSYSEATLDSLMAAFKTQKELQKAGTAREMGSYFKANSQYYKSNKRGKTFTPHSYLALE